MAAKAESLTSGKDSRTHAAEPRRVAPLVTMSSTRRIAEGGETEEAQAIVR